MGDTDKFTLKWNDFEKNIVGAYKDLRTEKDFFDCSLVCGGRTYQAHRVILSACSPVFREMIRETNHHHPVVYMRGVSPEDLLALLDFMYHGEASVYETDLERFIDVAEDLQVRGLLINGDGEKDNDGGGQPQDMDTALDDDVNDLLAGLDGQPPPSKRVKQERNEARETRPQFNITTANGGQAPSSVQDRIRVKREAGLSSLPSGISMQKVAEPAPAPPAPVSASDYTPPPGITLTRPGQAPAPSTAPPPSPAQPNIAALSSITATPLSSLSPRAPARPPTVSAALSHVVRPPLQQPRPGVPSPLTAPRPAAPPPSYSASGPVRPVSSPVTGLRPGLPPPPGARPLMSPARPQQPLMSPVRPQQPLMSPVRPQQPQVRGQTPVEHPVLHLPEGFSAAPGAGAGVTMALPGAGPSAQGMFGSPGVRPPTGPGGVMMGQAQQAMSPQQQLMMAQQQQLQQQQLQQLQQVGNVQESDTPRTPTPQSPQCQVEDLIEKAGAKLACKECKKTYSSKSKAQLVSHIESQHLKLEVKCDLCDKQFKATSYLKQHQKKGACAPPST